MARNMYTIHSVTHIHSNCLKTKLETLMVGSHDQRSLQLFPKMYYYASPTLRSETTLPLKNTNAHMLKTTPCNRWKIFLSIPYPHVITFCLVWQHHDVFQTSATASKRLRIEPKSCIHMQLFEATCVRNLLIVKNLEHWKFQEWYHVKEERLFYLFLHSKNYVMFTLTTQNCFANFCDKHPKSKSSRCLFGWCCCFRAYCLISIEWHVKRIVD